MAHEYCLTTLRNGVRIASVQMPHMESVCVGIWAAVGGRHEPEPLGGISHFIEHLVFKGTKNRSARQILHDVEGIGGYLNAFTTEDHTCYYAKGCASHLPVLCDVLCDMYLNSTFAPSEIARECDVIREEILMYRDQPAQHAQELLSATMWPDHPLGRPLTGKVETISKFRRPHFKRFMRANYSGRTTIVTVAGKMPHQGVVAILEPLLAQISAGRTPRYSRCQFTNGRSARVALVTQETEQTHLAMGFHAFGRRDERRFALKLLSVILGENMSSRLFQKLREKHGFCYSVQSGMVALSDEGLINVYAGLDTAKLEKAVRMIMRELDQLCHKAPSAAELRTAKDYTIGQTLMGLESTTNQAMWMGESLLGYGKVLDPDVVHRKLLAVTPEEVRSVACHCLRRGRLGVAIVGPVKDEARVKEWLR
jgi:predicted Zn-dependent peptidase